MKRKIITLFEATFRKINIRSSLREEISTGSLGGIMTVIFRALIKARTSFYEHV